MSREIKFRAWLEYDKRMAFSEEVVVWDNNIYINKEKKLDSKIKGYSTLSIMQYTGLKDRNGKEIYEGDVIKASIECGILVTGQVYWNYGALEVQGYVFKQLNNLEVIGNIYENPELLERSNAKN
ncbi:YopX family protein [Marinilactibacillus psychrotolerans]|uniref:YopX family protein n=1 Tax=Marinilactibacillus psychrotolerans TaxID=191770 RepID=UPI0039B05317